MRKSNHKETCDQKIGEKLVVKMIEYIFMIDKDYQKDEFFETKEE